MRPRARLDRETVVRTAVELTDAGGQVTLSAVAKRLGVQTPSLYNHIDGQAGLQREMMLVGLRELNRYLTRAAIGKSAGDALVAVARAYRAFAREHPGLYALTLRAAGPDDPELRALADEAVAVLAAVMESYRLRGEDAIHAIRGLRSMLHGFVSLEAAGGFGLPTDLDESFERSLATFIRGLQAEAVVAAD